MTRGHAGIDLGQQAVECRNVNGRGVEKGEYFLKVACHFQAIFSLSVIFASQGKNHDKKEKVIVLRRHYIIVQRQVFGSALPV